MAPPLQHRLQQHHQASSSAPPPSRSSPTPGASLKNSLGCWPAVASGKDRKCLKARSIDLPSNAAPALAPLLLDDNNAGVYNDDTHNSDPLSPTRRNVAYNDRFPQETLLHLGARKHKERTVSASNQRQFDERPSSFFKTKTPRWRESNGGTHGSDGETVSFTSKVSNKDTEKEKRRFSCASIADIEFSSAPLGHLASKDKVEWPRFLSQEKFPMNTDAQSFKPSMLRLYNKKQNHSKKNDDFKEIQPTALQSHQTSLSPEELLQRLQQEKREMQQELVVLTQKLSRFEIQQQMLTPSAKSSPLSPAGETTRNSVPVSSASPNHRKFHLVRKTNATNSTFGSDLDRQNRHGNHKLGGRIKKKLVAENDHSEKSGYENRDTTEEASSFSFRERMLWKPLNKRIEKRFRKGRTVRKGQKRSRLSASKRKHYVHRFGTRIFDGTSGLRVASNSNDETGDESKLEECTFYRNSFPLPEEMCSAERHSNSCTPVQQKNSPHKSISTTENDEVVSTISFKDIWRPENQPSSRSTEGPGSLPVHPNNASKESIKSENSHCHQANLPSSSPKTVEAEVPLSQLQPKECLPNNCDNVKQSSKEKNYCEDVGNPFHAPIEISNSQLIPLAEGACICLSEYNSQNFEEVAYACSEASTPHVGTVDYSSPVSQNESNSNHQSENNCASLPRKATVHHIDKCGCNSHHSLKSKNLNFLVSKNNQEARYDCYLTQRVEGKGIPEKEVYYQFERNNDTIHSLEYLRRNWVLTNEVREFPKETFDSFTRICERNNNKQMNEASMFSLTSVGNMYMPTSELMVEGEVLVTAALFEETVRVAKALLRLFCHCLVEVRDGLISEDLNLYNKTTALNLIIQECMPDAYFARPHHQKYGILAYISDIVFQDFQTESYGLHVDSHYPDRRASQFVFWNDFQCLSTLSPQDAIDMRNENYQKKFHYFCNTKFRMLEEKMDWLKVHCPDMLLESFLEAMKQVWQAHLLAFAFRNPASMLYVEEWAEYNVYCMKTVEVAAVFTSKVEFMVTPGFELEDRMIKSEVYLMPRTGTVNCSH